MNFLTNQPEIYTREVHEDFFVGWPTKPRFQAVRKHLEKTESIIASRSEEVIGVISALTDGELFAFIPLLEVKEEHQRQGVGTALLQAMESHLGEIYGLDLVCDSAAVTFYKSLGFTEISGMVKRNRGIL